MSIKEKTANYTSPWILFTKKKQCDSILSPDF